LGRSEVLRVIAGRPHCLIGLEALRDRSSLGAR
jgi:hypothetical protein